MAPAQDGRRAERRNLREGPSLTTKGSAQAIWIASARVSGFRGLAVKPVRISCRTQTRLMQGAAMIAPNRGRPESTQSGHSGLHILPIFKTAAGIDVHVVAVGTGQALAIGERGDADALLVHDRTGEDKLVRRATASTVARSCTTILSSSARTPIPRTFESSQMRARR
jgi:hypothetical protein